MIPTHPFVIDEHRPLSQSRLWDLQRQYYVRQGIDAWREGAVPHYITTNAFIARSYAKVVVAHLLDEIAHDPLARQKGVHMLELGAGGGRFAFHFLKHFLPMWADAGLVDVPLRYVMTDVAPRTIEFWRGHRALAPFVERGLLAFASCEAESGDDLRRAFGPDRTQGALVVFANYVFDALRADLFLGEEGGLSEGRVALRATRAELDPADPLASVHLEVGRRPLENAPYEDPIWNETLRAYAQAAQGRVVLFPTGAMRCIDHLRALDSASLLMLSVDEGSPRLEEALSPELKLLNRQEGYLPEFPVNYHALGAYVANRGGQAFFASHRAGGLCTAAFAWDARGRDRAATRHAFHDTMDLFGPDDFFVMAKSLERTGAGLTSEEMLAHLRWSAWDAKVLHTLIPQLAERLPKVPKEEIAAWVDAMERVWSLYYHLRDGDPDIAFSIAAVLARAGQWRAALAFFMRSAATWGEDGNTTYNIAVCHARLGERTASLACVDQALKSTPGHTGALGLQRELSQRARES